MFPRRNWDYPTPSPPSPIPRNQRGRGAHSPAGEDAGESQFRRPWKKSLALCLLCGYPSLQCLGAERWMVYDLLWVLRDCCNPWELSDGVQWLGLAEDTWIHSLWRLFSLTLYDMSWFYLTKIPEVAHIQSFKRNLQKYVVLFKYLGVLIPRT
jgi:hypothetical protein